MPGNKYFAARLCGLGLMLVITLSSAQAVSFEPLGVRALGMGGANVASVRDGNASYWNPAAYGFFGNDDEYSKAVDNNRLGEKDFGFGLDVQTGLGIHGELAKLVDTIGKIDFNAISQASRNNTYNPQLVADSLNLLSQLNALNQPKTGVELRADGSFDVRVGHFGLGYHLLGGVSVSPFVDTLNVSPYQAPGGNAQAVVNAWAGLAPPTAGPGYVPQYFTQAQYQGMINQLTAGNVGLLQAQQAVAAVDAAMAQNPAYQGQQAQIYQTFITMIGVANAGTIDQNTSTLYFRGVALSEVPLTYGYALSPNLAVGGSLKYMQARIYAHDMRVFGQNSSNFSNNATKRYTTDSNFGLDLGLLYRGHAYQLGLVARNLNAPKFSGDIVNEAGQVVGRYVYKAKPQLKAGAAWMPWDTFTIEMALDLTKNDTVMPGYKSQFVNAGLEWDIFRFLALRLGAYKNLAENDIGTVVTAGLGLNLWLARIDIGAAMGTKKLQYKGKSYPSELRAAAAVNVDF